MKATEWDLGYCNCILIHTIFLTPHWTHIPVPYLTFPSIDAPIPWLQWSIPRHPITRCCFHYKSPVIKSQVLRKHLPSCSRSLLTVCSNMWILNAISDCIVLYWRVRSVLYTGTSVNEKNILAGGFVWWACKWDEKLQKHAFHLTLLRSFPHWWL